MQEHKSMMFPLLDRNLPHVEETILAYMGLRDLQQSALVCKEWYHKTKNLLCQWYVLKQRSKGEVPLIEAAGDGYDHLVYYLLKDNNTLVNEEIKYKRRWDFFYERYVRVPDITTALLEAVIQGNDRIVELLMKREDVEINKADHHGRTALYFATLIKNWAIVKQLLQRKDIVVNGGKFGKTPLIEAAACGMEDIVELLLERSDIDVNEVDKHGQTSLMRAIKNGHETVVKYLLQHPHIDVNNMFGYSGGFTPLMWAVHYRRETIVQDLLKHPKIDVDVASFRRHCSFTALCSAKWQEKGE